MNSMSRYFLPADQWAETLRLTGDEAHHCVRVLRSKVGDQVEVFDGKGGCARGVILSASKSEVEVEVQESWKQDAPANTIELCQAIPKGSNMEWIVQKAVELGVRSIQPLVTENTVARSEQLEKKRQKWQRTVLEACKQCGQNFLPEVLPILTFQQWIEQRDTEVTEVVAALDPRSEPIKQKLESVQDFSKNVRIVIGPEGDFSKPEYDEMYEDGAHFVSIGDIVLKVETATLYCISVLKYHVNA